MLLQGPVKVKRPWAVLCGVLVAILTPSSSFGMINDDCDVSGSPGSVWIIGDHTAIEVKAKETVSPQDLRYGEYAS